MVHRIFKNIVPRTNRKKIELDLLKRYTTLFAIRHLLDGGIDLRYSASSIGFMNLPQYLQHMMSDWFITKDRANIEDDINENEGRYIELKHVSTLIKVNLLTNNFKVNSPVDHIFNISLRKHVLRRNVEASLLSNFQAEIALAYEDLGDYSATLKSSLSFFENVSFYIKENSSESVQYRIHVGDVVTFNTGGLGGSFAIVRMILCHQKNDRRFAFIIIDFLEETNQTKLDCPIYKLRTMHNQRRIFSISMVDAVNTVHFVHNCKVGECIGGNHNLRNDLYIRNIYFFKAV